MSISQAPKGAQHYVHGLYYKVGVHKYLYVWANNRWIKSSQTLSEILQQVAYDRTSHQRKRDYLKKHYRRNKANGG